MAGIFNTHNWKNLFFGKGGGKGKGDGKGDPHDIYKPIEGQRVLSFVDMSNRVQHLCRTHETERADKEEETKLEKSDARMKQLLAEQYGFVPRKKGSGKGSGAESLTTPAKKRSRTGAGAIDSLSPPDNDDDDDEPIYSLAHKEVAMAAKTIEAICEKAPLKVKICIHENKEKPIKLIDAAEMIVAHPDFNAKTWHTERAKTLNLSDSAGRKNSNGITDEAAVVGCLMAKLVCQGKSY
jgi:hypothetical protein